MHKIRNIVRLFWYTPLLIGLVVGALIGGSQATPAKAAIASSYQLPCQPYGSAYYAFMQYVSGWGYHTGEDVCHSAGIPIYATASGTVVYSARTPDSYRWGNLVMIEHVNADGGRAVSLYGHLADNRQVAAGQQVAKGQLLGFVGSQGPQNGNWGPHLHFGIHAGGYAAAVGTYASWVHGYSTSGSDGWLSPSTFVNDRLAAYDYVPVGVAGNTNLSFNGSSTITLQVRNSGSQTWRKDGNSANPVRLGTWGPLDHGSIFAQGGPGWVDNNRIKLDADTAPGDLATFTARYDSNRIPNNYIECFSVLLEGQAWMSGSAPVCVAVTVQPSSYRSAWVTQMITTNVNNPTDLSSKTDAQYLKPGQKVSLKAMLKNTGEIPWEKNGPNPVRLGTTYPGDRPTGFATGGDTAIDQSENWPNYNRPSGIDGKYDAASNTVDATTDTIQPGETAFFSFTITVPEAAAGTYIEHFNPVVEGAGWMSDIGMWYGLRVVSPGLHYDYVTQSQSTVNVGRDTTQVTATLQLRNSGRDSWNVGGNFKLGTDQPMDNASPFNTATGSGAWETPNRISNIAQNLTSPGKTTVDAGEIAKFNVTITVPALPVGSYKVVVRPLVEGVAWLPEWYGIYFPINITTPPYDYQVMRQSFSTDLTHFAQGGAATATLAIKNNGRAVWAAGGSNPVRLGTSRPNDRDSGFATTSGSDAWINPERATGIDGKVTSLTTMATTNAGQINPGEIAYFTVLLKADVAKGGYNEYFNLVAEGVTWMPDYGVYFPISVVDPGSILPTPTPTPVPPSPSPTPTPAPVTSWATTGNLYTACTSSCSRDTANLRMYSYGNFKVTYQTPANLAANAYKLNVNYRNINGALPAGYAYHVLVRVNGTLVSTVDLPGTQTNSTFTIPGVNLSGSNNVSLEWTNDYYVPGQYDANLVINSLSAGL